MSTPRDPELVSIYTQANDIARQCDRTLSTAHLLLALFTIPNEAALFLEDRAITVDALLEHARSMESEPDGITQRVETRSLRIARGSQCPTVTSLHLLAALMRESSSQAHQLLTRQGANVSAIRASVMSYATGSRTLARRIPARDQVEASVFVTAVARELAREHAPSPIQIHPSLGARSVQNSSVIEPRVVPGSCDVEEAPDEEAEQSEPRNPARSRSNRLRRPRAPQKNEDTHEKALEDAHNTTRKLAQDLFRKRRELLEKRRQVTPPEKESTPDESSDSLSTSEDATRCEHVAPSQPAPVMETAPEDTTTGLEECSSPAEVIAPARKSTVPKRTRRQPDLELARAYKLDPDEYPNLTKFGRNLCEEAALARLDPVLGRNREITQLIDILGKRRSNNPLLVGDAGVGKTAIVEGLANEFVRLASDGSRLGKRAILEIEVGDIIGGTHLRGSFSERLTGIKDEVRRAEGDIIVFLDEIHGWMNAGAGGDGTDAAGELKTALARGEFPCIGATTVDEFRTFVEGDPAFERRFDVVLVDEPDEDTAYEILQGIRQHYEAHHQITYDSAAVRAAVDLSQRFIHERRLPDKAVGVLDLAGSRATRRGEETVTAEKIAAIVAELAGIPAQRLSQSERDRFLNMESHLAERIVGHTEIVHTVSEVVRRNYAGFRSSRPIGSMLFLGPTGVGKTEMVKALADFLFFDDEAIVRFDMSEFMESHSVSRLLGAPPGYVGFEAGGQLTEAVRRRPYQVVLLDEIEKAHPDVLNVLLQLLDEGKVTDGRGRTISFNNCVIVMTSNLGSSVFDAPQRRSSRIGFGGGAGSQLDSMREQVLDHAKDHFPPEIWNRIDERLVFAPLTRSEVARIAGLQLASTAHRLDNETGIGLVFSEDVIRYLTENGGFDPALGARPMRQTIQREVEGAIARMILVGEATSGDTVYVSVEDDALKFSAEN